MNITNKKIQDLIDKSGAYELGFRVREYINDEGMNELDWVIRECEWVLEDYTEDTGHIAHDEYLWAKNLLRKSKNGTRIVYSLETFQPFEEYSPENIELAKRTVQEVKDTKKLLKQLQKLRKANNG